MFSPQYAGSRASRRENDETGAVRRGRGFTDAGSRAMVVNIEPMKPLAAAVDARRRAPRTRALR